MAFVMNSPAFADGQEIPSKYARQGENLSPPLEWHDAPAGTESFALIVEDPDAPKGTFRHWAIYNIPSDQRGLAEGVRAGSVMDDLAQAVNDFDNVQYDGPQPPAGHGTHHYHFRLAALNVPRLDLPSEAKAQEIWEAARPHVISEAEIVGTFAR